MGAEIMQKSTSFKPIALLTLLVVFYAAAPTQAAFLPVGGFLGPAPAEFHPGVGSVIPAGGQLLNVPFVDNSGLNLFSGLLTTTVYQDTTNVFGPGRLTFVYELTNSQLSVNSLTRLSTDPFTGLLTDGSYVANGGWVPGSVDRPSAAVVGFNFGVFGPGPLPPGATSALLVMQTDATQFQQGFAQVLGGGQAPNIATLVPIPEPASLGALALLGAFAFRRR